MAQVQGPPEDKALKQSEIRWGTRTPGVQASAFYPAGPKASRGDRTLEVEVRWARRAPGVQASAFYPAGSGASRGQTPEGRNPMGQARPWSSGFSLLSRRPKRIRLAVFARRRSTPKCAGSSLECGDWSPLWISGAVRSRSKATPGRSTPKCATPSLECGDWSPLWISDDVRHMIQSCAKSQHSKVRDGLPGVR